MESSERGFASFFADGCHRTSPLEPRRLREPCKRSVGLVEEVLPAFSLMALTDNLTFRTTESHDERSVGLVEGGERCLASFVADGCHR